MVACTYGHLDRRPFERSEAQLMDRAIVRLRSSGRAASRGMIFDLRDEEMSTIALVVQRAAQAVRRARSGLRAGTTPQPDEWLWALGSRVSQQVWSRRARGLVRLPADRGLHRCARLIDTEVTSVNEQCVRLDVDTSA